MATGSSFPGLSDLGTALPNIPPSSREQDSAPQELELKVLLWNINNGGMAEAREMLLEEVVKKTDSDIVLLQEVKTKKILTRIQENSPPQRSYECHKSENQSEAVIMYDTNRFEFIEVIDIIELIGRNNLSGLAAPDRELRGGLTRDKEYYSDHTCALRLRSKRERREFVVVSFHNSRRDTEPNTLGFLKLIELIYEQQNVPVIVGGDFNHKYEDVCSLDLTPDYTISDFLIPNYNSSERRTGKRKIDLFIIRKPHPPITITHEVEVFEALPLVDPTSSEADTHPLEGPVLKRLAGPRGILPWQEFDRVSNHDPTIGVFTIRSGQ